jgi:hypothetical protein
MAIEENQTLTWIFYTRQKNQHKKEKNYELGFFVKIFFKIRLGVSRNPNKI